MLTDTYYQEDWCRSNAVQGMQAETYLSVVLVKSIASLQLSFPSLTTLVYC